MGLLSVQFQPDKYPYPDQQQDVCEQSQMLRYVQSGECYSINTVVGAGDSDDSAAPLKANEPDSDEEQLRAIQAHIEKQEEQMQQSLKINVNPILQQLAAQTQPPQQQQSTKKNKRKRKSKQAKAKQEPPHAPEAKPESSINVGDMKSNINLSDVEDLTVEVESVQSPQQLTDQPRKNNFFRDDHSSVSSSATTPVKPLTEPSTAQLQSQSQHLQEISAKMT